MHQIGDQYIDEKRKITVALDQDSDENEYLSPNDVAIKQNIFAVNMNLKMLQNMDHHNILMLPEQNEDDESNTDEFVEDTSSESSTNEFVDTDDAQDTDLLARTDTTKAIACMD